MKKKNHVRARFSTIVVLCIPAILLCAAPCGWAVVYDDGGEHKIETGLDWLHVGADTTVNLYADVSQYIYAYPGSVLNIYSGNVALYIIVMPGDPKAAVTVYGTDFAVNGEPVSYGQVTMNSVLTGTYGNGDPISLKVYSSVLIQLSSPAVSEVKIDIKPGGNPNNINLRSKGVVPVAVLTTEDFDASNVDPDTVLFAVAEPVRWKLCDVDDDGKDDMLFHFKTQDLKLAENDTGATLTGKTFNGVGIGGTDTVRIVPSKKK
ncbi:hypothetical protein ES707_06596 [subsurface metagenome]